MSMDWKSIRLILWLALLMIGVLLLFSLTLVEGGQFPSLSSQAIIVEAVDSSNSKSVQDWTLLEKVEECKEALRNSSKLEFVEKKGKLIKKQVALCVLNIETGEVLEKRFWLDEQDVARANKLRRNYQNNPNNLPKFMPIDPQEDFEVTTNWWNNWASDLSVEKIGSASNDIYIVAGNKFSVPNSYIDYPEDKTGPKYSDIVFVSPYPEGIHDPEIVRAGIEFLSRRVSLAFDELRSQGIKSLSFPDQLVVDTMSETFVKSILLVEQTDPDAILNKAKTDEEKRKVAEKVLLRYGLNGDKAYRYTVSKAGAAGPAQIMASTGSLMYRTYPEANLFRDIDIGRLDMVNAIKTEILVFDHHLSEVRRRVNSSGSRAKTIFTNLNEDLLDEVRGMVYNGGPSKYNVVTGGLNMRKKGAGETKLFLEKLRVIRGLKLFDV